MTGYVFLPDDWTLPSGATFTANTIGFTTNTYTAESWLVMEEAGAVFLPAAGLRYGSVSGVGTHGNYWSSTYVASDVAYRFYFSSSTVYASNYNSRYYGHSVRLAQEL